MDEINIYLFIYLFIYFIIIIILFLFFFYFFLGGGGLRVDLTRYKEDIYRCAFRTHGSIVGSA